MQNSKHKDGLTSFPECSADPTYPNHVIVISQFEAKVNAQRILNIMKKYQNDNTRFKQVTNKGFHFKFSDENDAFELTGY